MRQVLGRAGALSACDPGKREVGARAAELIRRCHCHVVHSQVGGATGARTPDLLHAMQMLSQLSYRPADASGNSNNGPVRHHDGERKQAMIDGR